jgi:hypothetical protein
LELGFEGRRAYKLQGLPTIKYPISGHYKGYYSSMDVIPIIGRALWHSIPSISPSYSALCR